MAANKQQKVYLIPEGETRDSHTYHYTVVKTKKFMMEFMEPLGVVSQIM